MLNASGGTGPQTDQLVHEILEANWRHDAALSDEATLKRIATQVGFDADALLNEAKTPEAKAKLAVNTQWAIDNHIFGSPTYIVGGDAFYGQDHLPLVDRARTQPFAASHWHNPPVG